jgi:TP901 family phage tail tape measure protein
MATDLGLGITVSLKDQFSSASKNVSRSMGGMRQNAQDTVATMQRMQGAITAVAGAAIFMASRRAFGSVIDSASGFQKAMAEVSTLVDTSAVNMANLGDATLGLSKKFGFSALDQAKGLYQVLSAGIGDTAESLRLMDIANQVALGGVTDVSTAVDGLTTILNAWKMKASDASNVADTLFTTMRLGKTTIPELSNFIFQAAPLASALGISLEELGASIVTMTKQGTKTPIAMTQLRNVMAAIIRPSEDLMKVWKGLGFSSGEAAIQSV